MTTKQSTAEQETASTTEQSGPEKGSKPDKTAAAQRKIPGNLPYLTASGTLKKVLDRAVELAKPDKFNYDFLENVVKLTGGAARACISIMKRMGLLSSDNSTTELYSRFRTEGGRSSAAHAALRNAFPEIFKRSDYAHKLEDSKLRDIIVEITGLKANDPVAQAIKGTFNVLKGFIDPGFKAEATQDNPVTNAPHEDHPGKNLSRQDNRRSSIGLSYSINIVLPETSD